MLDLGKQKYIKILEKDFGVCLAHLAQHFFISEIRLHKTITIRG